METESLTREPTFGIGGETLARETGRLSRLVPQPLLVGPADRLRLLGHGSKVLWLTGLSGSGKSTLARHLERRLADRAVLTAVLDGDNLRLGLNADLRFSARDRTENIRRIREVARLFRDAGLVVIVCAISPFRHDREEARRTLGADFVEVHVDCPLEECERRDVKGLYRAARAGAVSDFTGVTSPYEPPVAPELSVNTAAMDVAASVDVIFDYVYPLIVPARPSA